MKFITSVDALSALIGGLAFDITHTDICTWN